MQVRLLLQPYEANKRIGAALLDRAPTATHLWLLSAWAQESGVSHLRPVVDVIRQRNGQAEAILGVDQGIATYEGLRDAMALFDAVYLFHDGDRTFHPKMYVLENDRAARIIVGSGNATEGGLYTNFEAAAAIDLDRTTRGDEQLRREARRYFESFLGTGMPFRRLDAALLHELQARNLVARAAQRRQAEDRRRRQSERTLRQLFGGAVRGLPAAPPRQRRTSGGTSTSGGATGTGTQPGTTAAPATTIVMSWWRQLTVSDAMKKPPPSHQRKHVILNRGPHPIDQTVFFRQHFFQAVPWSQQVMRSFRGRPPRQKEVAVVPFDVTIAGRHLGIHNLSIDHAMSRVADQGNSPTWLNWSSLGTEIARANYVGWFLVLERLANGTFRLSLQRSQPAAAVIPPNARTSV